MPGSAPFATAPKSNGFLPVRHPCCKNRLGFVPASLERLANFRDSRRYSAEKISQAGWQSVGLQSNPVYTYKSKESILRDKQQWPDDITFEAEKALQREQLKDAFIHFRHLAYVAPDPGFLALWIVPDMVNEGRSRMKLWHNFENFC